VKRWSLLVLQLGLLQLKVIAGYETMMSMFWVVLGYLWSTRRMSLLVERSLVVLDEMGRRNNCLVPRSFDCLQIDVSTNVGILGQRKVPFLVESLLVYKWKFRLVNVGGIVVSRSEIIRLGYRLADSTTLVLMCSTRFLVFQDIVVFFERRIYWEGCLVLVEFWMRFRKWNSNEEVEEVLNKCYVSFNRWPQGSV
jgi:hypothetical protein